MNNKLMKKIKCFFCNHLYGDAKISPFMNTDGNRLLYYTCEKCGDIKIELLRK